MILEIIILVMIINIIYILKLSFKIQQLEDEKERILNESIKEINKLRNGENKNE